MPVSPLLGPTWYESVGLLLVILFNGFQKKTQKTPVSEIDKAERLMKEYFNNK